MCCPCFFFLLLFVVLLKIHAPFFRSLWFQVFYVMLQFYSPQPRRVTIERQKSADSEWEVWQRFADDCPSAFGMDNNGPLDTPTSVNCIQFET